MTVSLDVVRPNVTLNVVRNTVTLNAVRPTVVLNGGRFAGIGDAPNDGTPYVRKNLGWVSDESAGVLSKIAGEDLGGHRVLVTDASDELIYADNSILTHRWKIIGISAQAALIGNICTYAGDTQELTEGSWSWDTNLPIYLTGEGLLTQTPPTTGFIMIVAFPTSATSLQVKISNPITFEV